MFRAFRSALLSAFALLIIGSGASALEFRCIEASRYKHLVQLFGGDAQAFARYLELNDGRLPDPEHCRAVLITGPIELKKGDGEKLLAFILQQQGWLAELYLGSGGGSVFEGFRLGHLVRTFWLKTRTVQLGKGAALAYQPDLAPAPPDTIQMAAAADRGPTADGWRAYRAAIAGLPPLTTTGGRCASACGLLDTAGVDRTGEVFVHRPRYSAPAQAKTGKTPGPNPAARPEPPRASSGVDTSMSMARTEEGLLRSERANVLFYERMDAGPRFIATFKSTSTLITASAEPSRFPRFIQDFLWARCQTDPAQLSLLDRQLRAATADLSERGAGVRLETSPLYRALSLVFERRRKVEQCVAAAHERERLSAFAKQCERGCDPDRIMDEATNKSKDVIDRAKQ